MAIINFWVAYNDSGILAQVEGFLPTQHGFIAPISHLQPPEEAQARIFSEDAGWKLRSLYRRIDDLSDIVVLRESLQGLQVTQGPNFYTAGMWHFESGQPVGGVGSPWFQTPDDVLSFMGSEEIEDTLLLAGQAKRQFI